MNVCHFTTVHKIDDVRIFTKECASLAANGFSVTLIAFGPSAFEDTVNGVKRISLHVPVKNRLHRFLKYSEAIYKKALEIDADIYHFHDPELLPVGLKLKKKGKKVIFDSHEFYGEQLKGKKYLPKLIRTFAAFLYKQYENYVCMKIDAVIQICTLNGENYFKNRAKRTEFINNAPLIQFSSNNLNYDMENRDSVVHIGTLSYNRGISHIVRAANMANTKLILGGNFNSRIYKNKLTKMNEFSSVDFKGYIYYDEMEEIFNKCFAGLSTLLHVNQYDIIDTLPTKVYNYMAAGLPVIISNTKYSVDLIKKYKFGIVVNPDNISEIANAITYLKNNKFMAKKMGENGRRILEEKFNWQIEEKKLINLYNSL